MKPGRDSIHPLLGAATTFIIYWVIWNLLIPPLRFIGGEMVADTIPLLLAAALASSFGMMIFESRGLGDLGFSWGTGSRRNFLVGLALGACGALLLIVPLVALGVAHFERVPSADISWRAAIFMPALLLCGAAGEEILFRGFMLQYLIKGYGAWAGILGMGALFGLLTLRTLARPRWGWSTPPGSGFCSAWRWCGRRTMDAHRDALRVERRFPVSRGRSQRTYNKSDGVPAGMGWRRIMERRQIRSGGQSRRVAGTARPVPCGLEDSGLSQQGLSFGSGAGVCFVAALLASFVAQAGVIHPSDKLTDDEKIALVRDLSSEYAKTMVPLPKSAKALGFKADGTWDKGKWQQVQIANGNAARGGEEVQITKVTLEGDAILFEINGGLKSGKRFMDHVYVGAGPVARR